MSGSVENTSGKTALQDVLSDINLGPTDSIQFAFAKLQLAQAQICKNSASQYLQDIQNIQKEQSETAQMIAKARELQNACKSKTGDCSWDKEASMMPKEMADWMKERGLSYDTTGGDLANNYDEWTYNLESLTNYQESISNKTQTLMVYLQDFISQYNSYLQGANSAVQTAGQVTTAIATGR
ncbi:MAG: hypothetical protein SPJ12_02835 [Duodenibacillus sp.]|nr:hypothetical protein [Duodenibacillus sp.]